MIVQYYRPQDIETALLLLQSSSIPAYPMGGGTVLSRHAGAPCAVVDLQALPLNQIWREEERLCIGATATLQTLVDNSLIPAEVREAARKEVGFNLRQVSTIGGLLICGDGRSRTLSTLLAMDTCLLWLPENKEVRLEEWLPSRKERSELRLLLTRIIISADVNIRSEWVSRTPADRPLLGVSIAQWESGRARIVLGGPNEVPVLAFDGLVADATFSDVGEIACSHFINQSPKINPKFLKATINTLIQRLIKNNRTIQNENIR